MHLLLTRRARKWLENHAEDGEECGWRCKETRTEIRFVKINHLVRIPPSDERPCAAETLKEVYYPQCVKCGGNPAIGDRDRRLNADSLVSVSAARWTSDGRLI